MRVLLAIPRGLLIIPRRLNAHLSSVASATRSSSFDMPVELAARVHLGGSGLPGGRLSSFGFSGTIAHGAFLARARPPRSAGTTSYYRG